MAIEHPFQALFETFGRLPAVHAEPVNRHAYDQLWDLLAVETEQAGRCILLRSPRAGHGKTHLLSRLQHHLGSGHEFIPLHAAHGSHIDAATVTADTLARLGRSLPAGGGLSILDLLSRRLFAQALQPLVRSGEVPCQDREGALAALRNRPIETFDFHHPNAVTAHWAKENFEVLGPRLALELAQRVGSPLREVMFWVDALFRFASTPIDHPLRAGALIQAVSATVQPESQVFERLGTLLCLMTQLVRVVLVADDLEGFSADESAALKLAAFLGSLRHSAERVDAIVSVNRDIWESAFVPRLSAGLADRLAEVVVELEPLNRHEIIALLDARAPGLGERVYDRLDLTDGVHHARGILRSAGDAWVQAAKQNGQPSAGVPAPEPKIEVAPVESPSPSITVTPPAAVAAAMAAATAAESKVAAAPSGEAAVTAETPVAEPISVLLDSERRPEAEPEPVILHPEPVPVAASTQIEETPAVVWNVNPVAETPAEVPVATLVPEPSFQPYQQSAVIPVGTLIPDKVEINHAPHPVVAEPSADFRPIVQESPAAPFMATPVTFHETPLAQVLATEAALDPEPVAWPVPQAAPQAAAPVQASPVAVFQPTAFEFPSTALPQALVHSPPADTAFSTPPPVPASHAAQADATAPETDRVDELLRQFRERYAKG